VLVVEDDHDICELITDLLSGAGFETRCVQTDRQAYDILRTPPPFSAILVDVNLGAGTTGFDVARFARQVIPDVAVIYVSGEASPQSATTFGVPNGVFVAKPFTAEELLAAVESRVPAND
jgi:DNA-binding response OmpR family regulator